MTNIIERATDPLTDRYVGVLLGVACGDTLGERGLDMDRFAAALPASWRDAVQFRQRLKSEAMRLLTLAG
jgi:hypothetical protein